MMVKSKTVALAFWQTIMAQTKEEIKDTLLGLQSFYALYSLDRQVRDFFSHPRITLENKIKQIENILLLRELNSKITEKLLTLLLKIKQLQTLPKILALLHQWRNEQFSIIGVKSTSAVVLDAEIKENLKKHLQKAFAAKETELHEAVDPDLFGGIILRMNGQIMDASLKGKLVRIQNALKN